MTVVIPVSLAGATGIAGKALVDRRTVFGNPRRVLLGSRDRRWLRLDEDGQVKRRRGAAIADHGLDPRGPRRLDSQRTDQGPDRDPVKSDLMRYRCRSSKLGHGSQPICAICG